MSLKKELRQRIFVQRKEVSSVERKILALKALGLFVHLLEKYQPEICASYMPYNHEFDIGVINKFLETYKTILAFPTVEEDSSLNRTMNFRKAGEIEYGYQNILQPCLSNEIVKPNMIICPFVGVSANRERLGYGGGFYDKTISDLRSENCNPILVGIGYEFQLIEEPFAEIHDVIFDEVILLRSGTSNL